MNARGYKQKEGKHYFKNYLAAPVTNTTSVQTVLVLMGMNVAWAAEAVDND